MYGPFKIPLFVILVSHAGSTNAGQQCQNFNSSQLSNICGYDQTVRFRDQSYFNSSYEELRTGAPFGNCSDYSNLIHCSSKLPRCAKDLDGPYLPCKRVCDEYLKECQDEIIQKEQDYLVGFCQVLPESDDPSTTKGFLGRCFEPKGFRPSEGSAPAIQCIRLVVPQCQGFGYDETIWPEAVQKRRALDHRDQLINYTASGDKCGNILLRMDCEKFFPPCRDGNMFFKCKHRCIEDAQTCGTKNGTYEAACRKFPEGDGSSDYCLLTHWQAFDEWLKVPSTPAAGFRTREPRTDPPTAETNTQRTANPTATAAPSNSHRRKVVTAVVVSVVVVLVAAVVIVGALVFRRWRAKKYGYDRHLVYNANLVDQEGE